MFLPLKNLVRFLSLLLVLVILSACPTETPVEEQSAFAALAHGTVAQIPMDQESNHWIIPSVEPAYLDHNPPLNVYIKMEMTTSKPFSLWRLGLGLNGVRGHYPLRVNLARHAEWAKINGKWHVLVNLSRLKLYPNKSFADALRYLQARGAKVSLWVRSPSKVRSVSLIFVEPRGNDDDELKIPKVTIDTVIPEGEVISSRNISFYFSATEQAKRFYCSLDHSSFKKCVSPQNYTKIEEGKHKFRVYAVSVTGQKGPVTTYPFTRAKAEFGVEITKVTPSVSPTSSTSISIEFEANHSKTLSHWKKNIWHYWKTVCEPRHHHNLVCKIVKFQVSAPNFWPRDRAECQLDGAGFAPCESPVTYENLAEGAHTVEIRPIGKNTKEALYSWRIDRTAPVISWTTVPPAQTNRTDTLFEFESDEAVTFQCSLDGEAYEDCESPWEFTVAAGTHTVNVVARDLAGNGSETLTYVWTVGDTRPVVEILGINPQDPVTSQREMSVAFVTNIPAKVYCFLDAQPTEDEWPDYECHSPYSAQNLSEGEHTLILTAVSLSGDVSEPVSVRWTVDSVAPNLTLALESPLSVPTSSGEARFGFESDEAASFACSLDGGAAVSCHSPYELSDLEEGEHIFSVTARDGAGNISETSEFSWIVDQTEPTIEIVQAIPEETTTLSRSLQLDFSVDEPNVTLSCDFNRSGAEPCASPFIANDLADGDHQVEIFAFDAAGNEASLRYSWTVYSPAEVFIESTDPDSTITPFTSIQIDFSSPNSDGYRCRLDGGTLVGCASPVFYDDLADGEHRVQIYGVDLVGGLGAPAEHVWTVLSGPLQVFDVSVSEITQTSALITWKTNLPATSQVIYGVGNLDSATELDATYVMEHAVLLTDLSSFALHSVQAVSVDQRGRETRSSTQTFRTLR